MLFVCYYDVCVKSIKVVFSCILTAEKIFSLTLILLHFQAKEIVMSKAVVYYSLSGNTKEAAVEIARKLGAKIFEIEPLKPLPQNTVRQMIVGGMQSTFGRKPQIKGVPDNIDYYDEIILGTPIWAGMPAAPVNTFIKKYGIADKIDAVFTFSGGGDNDRCMAQLSKTLKNIKNEVALADRNSEMAKDNHDKLEKFIMDIK